jgi:hypothetical protein
MGLAREENTSQPFAEEAINPLGELLRIGLLRYSNPKFFVNTHLDRKV